jgi:hypothetical protein
VFLCAFSRASLHLRDHAFHKKGADRASENPDWTKENSNATDAELVQKRND